MSPLYTIAKLCRLLMLLFGECSRAGRMFHSSTARRSEFSVT